MTQSAKRVGIAALCLSVSLAIFCCGNPEDFLSPELQQATQAVTVPAKGTASTLDLAEWNIEWFGDTTNGPTNETLQLQNVRDVINGTDHDIWGMEEVVSVTSFNSLLSQLPGYAGLLANSASVTNGSTYYSSTEQKVGIIYKTSIATVQSAQVILTASDYDFAGRPPLEVKLSVTLNGYTDTLYVIVFHAKAFNDTASWQRRLNASNALKSYLDTTRAYDKVVVLGDYNDDLDTSITSGKASPYKNFVDDSLDYFLPTKALTDAGISTTASYTDAIDHQMVTNELQSSYVAGSVEAYRVDQYISSYSTATSDHFPTLTRFNWGGGGGTPSVTVTAPNGGESWAGGSSQNITWTYANVSNVKLEYTLDNGGTWTVITSSTPASAGSYAWTVPSSASTTAKVRASDAANSATSDTSNATFTITTGGGGGPGKVIINEIMANEPGSNTVGEFVELVNVGGTAVDISGWTLSDATSVRHTFAAGTSLAAGKAIVVYGGSSGIPGGLTNAVAASTSTLSLGNSGDTVTVKNGTTTVATYTYSSSLSSQDGVSMNRSPDTSDTGSFVLHNTISSLSSSGGKRANGTSF